LLAAGGAYHAFHSAQTMTNVSRAATA
jgi:hypothetical protein